MLRKRLWLGIVVVVAAAVAFAGPSIIAGMSNTATASSGCGMDMGSSGGGCGMMGGTAAGAKMDCSGCAMLSGVVTGVDTRKGSMTVKITPDPNGGDAAKKLVGQVKVGDSLPLMVMLGKDGKPTACPMTGASKVAAKYACPMHPEVVSDKPGGCPKCGMDLVKTGAERK